MSWRRFPGIGISRASGSHKICGWAIGAQHQVGADESKNFSIRTDFNGYFLESDSLFCPFAL